MSTTTWAEVRKPWGRTESLAGIEMLEKRDRSSSEMKMEHHEEERLSGLQRMFYHGSEDFGNEVQRLRGRLRRNWRKRMLQELVDPRSKRMFVWDCLLLGALLFTATVTPMEAAFSRGTTVEELRSEKVESAGSKVLFIANRFVDVIFIFDVVKNLFLAYGTPAHGRSFLVVRDRLKRARRFALTWIPVHVVSVIPFDLIALAARKRFVSRMRVLRMLRFVRLFKLGMTTQIFERWSVRHAISYAHLALFKYVALIFMSAHWMTCVWVLVASLEPKQYTWVDALADAKHPSVFRRHSVSHRYCRGLYFTFYILTGLGLGDVTPSTNTECVVAILFIVYGGIIWALIIGNFCSIVTTMDIHGITFRQRMDELNFYMNDNNFPQDLKERCRMYFYQSQKQQRVATYAQLEKLMSVGLRGEVAAASNGAWLDQVWYLRGSPHDFVAELSQELHALTFSPAESLDLAPPTLFIMRSGIAARSGKILSKGAVWGADFVVDNEELIERRPAVALTYVDTITLSRDSLKSILLDFPAERVRIRKAMLWYLVRTLLQEHGRKIAQEKQDVAPRKKSAVAMLQSAPRNHSRRRYKGDPDSQARGVDNSGRPHDPRPHDDHQRQQGHHLAANDPPSDRVRAPAAPFFGAQNLPHTRTAAVRQAAAAPRRESVISSPNTPAGHLSSGRHI
ncbi:hypothetical protein CTAYLR_007021 [Chrysophaeum taylorii]|uniref:Ion transport domain-containing protein n=1 Tax=Chrysophaeum taylorii TaxID=2483200 RepID=A0AAD7U6Z5_9STRA|nr:hypothetical protein CTAYLR_007021 [Chrysophaeum taylorii]